MVYGFMASYQPPDFLTYCLAIIYSPLFIDFSFSLQWTNIIFNNIWPINGHLNNHILFMLTGGTNKCRNMQSVLKITNFC